MIEGKSSGKILVTNENGGKTELGFSNIPKNVMDTVFCIIINNEDFVFGDQIGDVRPKLKSVRRTSSYKLQFIDDKASWKKANDLWNKNYFKK